jgi:hypothetical protein
MSVAGGVNVTSVEKRSWRALGAYLNVESKAAQCVPHLSACVYPACVARQFKSV